jgi:hypothetical protein
MKSYHADLQQRELQGQAVHVLKTLESTRKFYVYTERLQFDSQLMIHFLTLPIPLVVFKPHIVCISHILFLYIL